MKGGKLGVWFVAVLVGMVLSVGSAWDQDTIKVGVVGPRTGKARELGIVPLASLESSAVAAADPTLTYPAVPAAVNKALARVNHTVDQMDLIEIQEAFAAQVLADAKLMRIPAADLEAKVNVNGSGISLGHPIGATGAMRMVTLLYELGRRNGRYGLVTICGGGGHGIAAIVQRQTVD
jgi:acetyl-CoA C-acetyltransferase